MILLARGGRGNEAESGGGRSLFRSRLAERADKARKSGWRGVFGGRGAGISVFLALVSCGAPAVKLTASPSGAAAAERFAVTDFGNGPDFTEGKLYSTAFVKVRWVDEEGAPVRGVSVTWRVERARNDSPAMAAGWEGKKTGLTWGKTPESGEEGETLGPERLRQERIHSADNNLSVTNFWGESVMWLTDIVGERQITVRAQATAHGQTRSVTQTLSFGRGPLSVFRAPDATPLTWDEAWQRCNGTPYTGDHAEGWTTHAYVGGGKMPTWKEYAAVAPKYQRFNSNAEAQGAAFAAGWPADGWHWTGEASGSAGDPLAVVLYAGYAIYGSNGSGFTERKPVACRR